MARLHDAAGGNKALERLHELLEGLLHRAFLLDFGVVFDANHDVGDSPFLADLAVVGSLAGVLDLERQKIDIARLVQEIVRAQFQ